MIGYAVAVLVLVVFAWLYFRTPRDGARHAVDAFELYKRGGRPGR